MTGSGAFRTTRWSLVQASKEPDDAGRAALGELCQRYWSPLYALARRSGSSPADAEDAVQGFLEGVIRRGDVQRADEERGSFRAFLRTAFHRHLIRDAEGARALKRGGGVLIRPLDAEKHYGSLQGEGGDPAALFERAFALRTLEAALEALRQSYAERGKVAQFEALRSAITAPDDSLDREAVARSIQMTRSSLDVAIHRLRMRYREALVGAVRDVTDSDADVEDELRWMFEVI